MESTRGHLVKIVNRDTGEAKQGNWAGLRKQLGVAQYMNADRTAELFESMGWEVASHHTSPEAKIREIAKAHNGETNGNGKHSNGNGHYVTEEGAEEEGAEKRKPETVAGQGKGGVRVIETDTELLVPGVNPDYIRRDVDDLLAKLFDIEATTPFLFGEAGCGKTEMVKEYAAERKIPYTRVSLDETMSLQYLIGRLTFREGQVYYQEGMLVKALQKPGVLFLDEGNAMQPSKGFLLHQLLDSGCIYIPEADKYYYKHPECRIVLAGNYQSGKYTGVQKMNWAFVNRLTMVEVPPMDVSSVKLSNVKGEEKQRLVKFYKEVERMLSEKKAKAGVSLRNVLLYDKLRGQNMLATTAVKLSFIGAVRYIDSGLGEEVEILATAHLDDL